MSVHSSPPLPKNQKTSKIKSPRKVNITMRPNTIGRLYSSLHLNASGNQQSQHIDSSPSSAVGRFYITVM